MRRTLLLTFLLIFFMVLLPLLSLVAPVQTNIQSGYAAYPEPGGTPYPSSLVHFPNVLNEYVDSSTPLTPYP